MASLKFIDVLIVGAGPVGLVLGNGLAQHRIKTTVIERRQRHDQIQFGRATTLYPRTLELLEQVGLTKYLIQAGFVGRGSVNFVDGKRCNSRGWQGLLNAMKDSYYDFYLNIRQFQSEEIFRQRYEIESGEGVFYGSKLIHYVIDTSLGDGYNVSATIEDEDGSVSNVRCKYLIGADGGSSTVRQLANINMPRDVTTYHWIRMDGKLKTNMPDANLGVAAVESKEHGNVLWVKLEGDAHRIGFSVGSALLEKYPNGISKEQAITEAVESMKPFTLEFERLDWWTHYVVKQGVADSLQKDSYVLLAGDAAHVHSSGLAQGMNTGVHDATNLVWKLAGQLKGIYKPGVLETYNSERRSAAEKLIALDKETAVLISGQYPAGYTGNENVHDMLARKMHENMGFTVGLGVKYPASVLNRDPLNTTIQLGCRAPDALVRHPGVNVPVRLMEVLESQARHEKRPGSWTIVVFGGSYEERYRKIPALNELLVKATERLQSFVKLATIVVAAVQNTFLTFGGSAVGNVYFDHDGNAHSKYGISVESGAITVLRPDGILGFASGLEEVNEVMVYLDNVFK